METKKQVAEEVSKLEPGNWEGQYLDARGYRAKLRLTIESREGLLEGSYELVVATEDKPQVVTGRLVGKHSADAVRFDLGGEKAKQTLSYEATLQPAGSYAKQCLMGIAKAPPGSDFGGGVWIAWRFEKLQHEK